MEHYYNEDHTEVAILTIAYSSCQGLIATENIEMAMDKRVIEFVMKEAKEDEHSCALIFEKDRIPYFDAQAYSNTEEWSEAWNKHIRSFNEEGIFSSFLKELGYVLNPNSKYHNVGFSIDWVPIGKRFRVRVSCYDDDGAPGDDYEYCEIYEDSEWVTAE